MRHKKQTINIQDMKQIKHIAIILLLAATVTSCNFFGEKSIEAFEAAQKEINTTTKLKAEEVASLKQQVTDSAMSNPAVYASAFNHMNEFSNKSDILLHEMQYVRDLIDAQIGETADYQEWGKDTDVLFFKAGAHSDNGNRFVKAMDNYILTTTDQLFFFPEAEKMAKDAFSTAAVMNREGDSIDWLTHQFKGFPAMVTKTKIATMESDVKKIEAAFLKALIEKPQF